MATAKKTTTGKTTTAASKAKTSKTKAKSDTPAKAPKKPHASEQESQKAKHDREVSQAAAAEPAAEIALHEAAQEGESSFRDESPSKSVETAARLKGKGRKIEEADDSVEQQAKPKPKIKSSAASATKRPNAADEGESALSAKEAINAAREAISSARVALNSARKAMVSAQNAANSAQKNSTPEEKKSIFQELSGTIKDFMASVRNPDHHP